MKKRNNILLFGTMIFVCFCVLSPAEESKDLEKTESAEEVDEEAEAKKKKEAEEKEKKARLEKLKKVKFDRRVSSLLGAWVDPDGSREAEKKKAEEGKEDNASETGDRNEEKADPDPLDASIIEWQRNVSLSNWKGVGEFLEGLEEEEAKVAYEVMLKSLASTTAAVIPELDKVLMDAVNRARIERRVPEPNFFSADDVIELIDLSPNDELKDEILELLGVLVRTSLERGLLVEEMQNRFISASDDEVLTKRDAAKIFELAQRPNYMGPFLPSLEEAIESKDDEGLNLLSTHLQSLYWKKNEKEYLEDAWNSVQAVLAAKGGEPEQREKALKAAVQLAPRVDEDLGNAWLEEVFNERPEYGQEVLEAIGGGLADLLQTRPTDTSTRYRSLELQQTAVEALLRVAPKRAREWQEIVNLLGNNWYREAAVTQRYEMERRYSYGMQRDRYGNYFYPEDDTPEYVPNQVRPISSSLILELQPNEAWLALIDKKALPNFQRVLAQLHLKTGDEEASFPFIEMLAETYPELAEDLVDEFLRVWTRNHDPNAEQSRTNSYMFMYGYEQKADGIPLTRSKQERNLEELAEVVARLRKFELESLDEILLVQAFSTSHSRAEVYETEAIEKVFGSLDQLEPETIAALAQQMRANLASVWRVPAEQKKAKTNRKQKDIQLEVMRGYRVANDFVASGLKTHPEAWSLHLVKAAIDHDENNYRQELDPDSEFSQDREMAFEGFEKAVKLYVETASEREEADETNEPFDMWFYASLGACDLGMVDDQMVADRNQPALIREAILSLPGEQSDRHLERFANSLFRRMSSVKPAVKYHYLRAGFDIVGEHEAAAEAKEVFDYYKDLVTEIELETVIDGSDEVGHKAPFGLFVNLRHTREIERESGGFRKYLQNQNSGGYYYNYGRPLANYREKFEEVVKQSLGEQFDIQSVTFQREDVNSRAVEPYGWRVTPYAYILLKAKGPEVDKIASLRLDLDFLDTSGYAVLPIESPVIPIDAKTDYGDERPVRSLSVVQTLDERQADKGKLLVEVRASGLGLIPGLESILEFASEGFEVVNIKDEGASVSKFDEESEESAVLTERQWIVEFRAEEGLPTRPDEFAFGQALRDPIEMEFQRYVDADLATVGDTISLVQNYGETSRQWVWWLVGGGILVAVIVIIVRRRVSSPAEEFDIRFQKPDPLTPFTVIGLLNEIHANNGLDQGQVAELKTTIGDLERTYFGSDSKLGESELHAIADRWVASATRRPDSG